MHRIMYVLIIVVNHMHNGCMYGCMYNRVVVISSSTSPLHPIVASAAPFNAVLHNVLHHSNSSSVDPCILCLHHRSARLQTISNSNSNSSNNNTHMDHNHSRMVAILVVVCHRSQACRLWHHHQLLHQCIIIWPLHQRCHHPQHSSNNHKHICPIHRLQVVRIAILRIVNVKLLSISCYSAAPADTRDDHGLILLNLAKHIRVRSHTPLEDEGEDDLVSIGQ